MYIYVPRSRAAAARANLLAIRGSAMSNCGTHDTCSRSSKSSARDFQT